MTTLCYIPYGAYWSTPFARWQGSLSALHSLEFAAHVAKDALAKRAIEPGEFDFGVLGTTIPQPGCFYGLPWVTGLIGAERVGGPTINQACATGARTLQCAASAVASEEGTCALVITADRTSNGPHLYYPNPSGPGGAGQHENWVLDNFAKDPYAGVAMIETAENAAARYQISTSEQHDVVLMRHEQYERARASGFHTRFMDLPFDVPDARFRKCAQTLDGDEGVYPTNASKLAGLAPVRDGGSVTLGAQTYPADGSAAMVLATRERAKRLSNRPEIEISVQGFGLARAEPAHMPLAPVPAAKRALEAAGITIDDITLVTTHNPFAVNDLVFNRETGFALERMNTHGCSLIWGHPQGPTGTRACIELLEGLAERGGGYGLFTGCAAGDSAMAVVVRVDDGSATLSETGAP